MLAILMIGHDVASKNTFHDLYGEPYEPYDTVKVVLCYILVYPYRLV